MTTVADVVETLGGNAPVAELLGISVQQVSNCKAENRFPPKHYMRLSRECASRGVKLPDELFERGSGVSGSAHSGFKPRAARKGAPAL